MATRNNRSDIHRKRHLRKREWRQALEKQIKAELATKAAESQTAPKAESGATH